VLPYPLELSIFLDHWEGFKKDNPWYDADHCNELVSKMLSCGDPKRIGFAEYQCFECGHGNRVVPMICPYCGAEMEFFRLWHSKYGTFYEGFVDLIAKPPPNIIADNKFYVYNAIYEQLVLLS